MPNSDFHLAASGGQEPSEQHISPGSALYEFFPDVLGFQEKYEDFADEDAEARIEFVKKNGEAAKLYILNLLELYDKFTYAAGSNEPGLARLIADTMLAMAERSAQDFAVAFQDPRYAILVANNKRWSQEQRLQNLKADELARGAVDQEKQGNFGLAHDKWQSAGSIYHSVGNLPAEADVLNNIGGMFAEAGRYREALPLFQKSLEIRQATGDRFREWSALTHIGVTYSALGDYSKALDLHNQALAIANQLDDKSAQGNVVANIGNVYLRLADAEKALGHYRQALAIFRELHDTASEGKALNNMALVYRDLGQYDEALQKHNQALFIASENKDKNGQGAALTNLGSVYLYQRKYNEALERFRKAMEVHKQTQNIEGIASTSLNIGAVYEILGGFEEALQFYAKAQELAVSNGNRRGEMQALAKMASVHSSMGDHDRAFRVFQAALALSQELGDRREAASILAHVGILSHELARYSESLPYFQLAHDLYQQINDLQGEAVTSLNLGVANSHLGKDEEALQHFDDALSIAKTIGDSEVELRGYYNTGRSLFRLHKHERALRNFEKAIEILEAVRGTVRGDDFRIGFLRGKTQVYTDTVLALVGLHRGGKGTDYDRRAFQYAEQAKARAVLDLLSESGGLVAAGVASEVIREMDRLDRMIFTLESSLRKHRSQPKVFWDESLIEDLEATLNKYRVNESSMFEKLQETYPRYAALVKPDSVTVSDLQNNLLGDREVLMEYVVTNTKIFLFVVSKSHFEILPIDLTTSELNDLVKRFQAQLADPTLNDLTVSDELYRKIFRPAEKYLPKKDSQDHPVAYVVADKALHYIPFEALTNGGRYLLDAYLFTYVPSASVLSLVRTRGKIREDDKSDNRHPLLVFADPRYSDSSLGGSGRERLRDVAIDSIRGGKNCGIVNFAALPGTSREAEALASMFQIDVNGEAFNVREKAKESRLKSLTLEQYRYLHFATHGFVCDETKGVWVQPSLVLSLVGEPEEEQARGNEGFLQMGEIFGLTLKADLVTLSACETGLGENVEGEGLLGLTRAFLHAGAQTVVVSLWSVSDPSTAALMKRFYRNLKKGMTKIEALAKAKRWVRRFSYHKDDRGRTVKHADPYFWAPFILVGMPS